MSFVFLSVLISYIIQNVNVDLHYILMMSMIELIAAPPVSGLLVFTLFMIFVVNSNFVVPVVRTLVCIYELCFQGVMGQEPPNRACALARKRGSRRNRRSGNVLDILL